MLRVADDDDDVAYGGQSYEKRVIVWPVLVKRNEPHMLQPPHRCNLQHSALGAGNNTALCIEVCDATAETAKVLLMNAESWSVVTLRRRSECVCVFVIYICHHNVFDIL